MRLPNTPSPLLRPAAALALVVEIGIHVDLAPDHLREVPYIGASFVVGSVLLATVLIGLAIAPRSAAVWLAGALVCTGMAVGFVASRTVGLPGLHEAWTSDGGLGLFALLFEAIFVAITARVLTAGHGIRSFLPRPRIVVASKGAVQPGPAR